MSAIASIQGWIVLVLSVAALGVEVYALLHAIRQRPDAFVAASKQTKPIWTGILVVAVLLGIASVGGLGLLGILGIVAAGVYLADVKPAIESLVGGSGRSRW